MPAYILSYPSSHIQNIPSLAALRATFSAYLGGGIAMGAFCIFGISRTVCKAAATKKTLAYDPKDRRSFSLDEWAAKRDELAEKMFVEVTRLVKVSPELDTPQFCRDWLAIDPDHVRQPVLMVRGPKIDKQGHVVKRNGVIVETWLEYSAECARLKITEAA